MFILSAGAIVNIVINYLLIPILGIEGASLATLMGYAVSDVICVIVLYKMKLMEVEKKFIYAAVGMIIFFILWRVFIPNNAILGLGLALVFCAYCILLYRNDIKKLMQMIKKSA